MMQTTRIQDPSFQTQHSGKCDLLLELLPSACHYAVLDIGQDQLKIVGEAADFAAFAKEDVLASLLPQNKGGCAYQQIHLHSRRLI